MNTVVKSVISIVLFFLGVLCGGLWPYITILPSLGLVGACWIGAVAIWRKRPVDGEGDIFKQQNKLNKD
tara:strand:+ start:98 stop:304 length:207 start_codon:yes stop_codon:yes gene_type:complete